MSRYTKTYLDFPLQDPPKITQIGIFGLKTNHLATLGYDRQTSIGNLESKKLCCEGQGEAMLLYGLP
jgi:hypothetical protein